MQPLEGQKKAGRFDTTCQHHYTSETHPTHPVSQIWSPPNRNTKLRDDGRAVMFSDPARRDAHSLSRPFAIATRSQRWIQLRKRCHTPVEGTLRPLQARNRPPDRVSIFGLHPIYLVLGNSSTRPCSISGLQRKCSPGPSPTTPMSATGLPTSSPPRMSGTFERIGCTDARVCPDTRRGFHPRSHIRRKRK